MPVIFHRPIGFSLNFVVYYANFGLHTKKAWHFFAFIGIFEVFDYLTFPITTSKAHAFNGGSAVASLWECLFESVEVSKIPVQVTSLFLIL